MVMGINKFTQEQVKKLKENPYVVSMTDKYINYSEEFKKLFWIDYQNGMTPSLIFKKYGFDPKELGSRRRDNFVQRLKAEAARPNGFKDTRKENSGRPATKDLTPEEEIARLKHKNRVLQQENDFLKRVRFINKKQLFKMQKEKPQEKNSN